MPSRRGPELANQAEEWAFRETHDTAGLIDWSRAECLRLPNLKSSTTAISLRLPAALLERIKLAANQCCVPHQSLSKLWLAEKAAGDWGGWGMSSCGRQKVSTHSPKESCPL